MNYLVYWIHLPEHTNYNTQGYVGITKDFNKRLINHKRQAPNPHFGNAIFKYGWENLVKGVIADGLDLEGAELLEEMLRPEKRIGWNVNIGGESVPSFKGCKHTDSSRLLNSQTKQGINNPANKLSPSDIINIYNRILDGESSVSIAIIFSVADTTIAKIKYGKKPYYRQVVSDFIKGTI